MKRLAKNLALVAISSLLTVLLFEGLLRLVPNLLPIEVKQALNSKGRAHPEIGNLPEPNSEGVIVTRDFESAYRVDQHGFRNAGKWSDETAIAVIGDSLVFGYGVEVNSAWPQRLAELNGDEVLNLGLIGASPQQYRKIHEKFVRPIKPAVVIVGFFARNDYWDADQFANWEKSGVGGNYLEWRGYGRPTAEQYDDPFFRIFFALRKRSYVLALVKFGSDVLLRKRSTSATELAMPSGSTMLLHGDDYRLKTLLSDPGEATFALVVDELRQIKEATLVDGSRLIVMLQPAKEEVYRETESAQLPDAAGILQEHLERLDIEVVDAGPAFRRLANDGEELFFPTDGHPNKAGYAVLAELMAAYLRRPVADASE